MTGSPFLFMELELQHILILALAVYRATSLLSSERGPKELLKRIRLLCGVRYMLDEHGNDIAVADTEIAKLISCPLCLSVWLGAIASALYITLGIVAVWMALPFALSALAIIADSLVDK